MNNPIIASHKVSIVCPFYNEAACIKDSTQAMLDILPKYFSNWELILVNDGSNDGSLEIISTIKNRFLRIISNSQNQGRGRAILNGIGFSTGEIIVTTEIDLSWGEKIIYEMVRNLIDKDLHLIIASPHMTGGQLVNVPLRRAILTCIGNFLIRTFTHMKITMSTGMTRAYRSDVIKPLQISANGKEAYLEILLKLYTLNFRIGEVPATIRWNKSNKFGKRKSSTNIRSTILTHLRFVLVAQPKFYFSSIAFLSLLVGTVFIVYSIYSLLFYKPSLALLIASITFYSFSLLCFSFSLIFTELRDLLRCQWSQYYQEPMPHALKSIEIFKN
jgi:glycosyltransferase involved in cell wall biosynthesis